MGALGRSGGERGFGRASGGSVKMDGLGLRGFKTYGASPAFGENARTTKPLGLFPGFVRAEAGENDRVVLAATAPTHSSLTAFWQVPEDVGDVFAVLK